MFFLHSYAELTCWNSMFGDLKMSSYSCKERKKTLFQTCQKYFLLRYIKSAKFDISSINFGKNAQYFLKVKFVFRPRTIYPKRRKQLGVGKRGLFKIKCQIHQIPSLLVTLPKESHF